ncbi:MAG: metallophosphoesterase [Verrucomicrobiales bacterium]|jgi:predicted phosphohydrolase|nr:metallophosphoesterase [Verrucomicrobiales bacterium]
MNASAPLSRRRALKTLFCSSAFLSLNLGSRSILGAAEGGALDLLMIGDFGTTGDAQKRVAAAMKAFCQGQGIKPESLLLLGDNFYSAAKDGFSTESIRWKNTFEDVYPTADFPGPCWAVLGNHDYHDNPGGEKVQLEYAKKPGTRWKMPAKWYRFDLGPASSPLATVIALDSNLPKVSGGKDKIFGKTRGSLAESEAAQQHEWLVAELQSKRAPFTIVMAHHPLYSNGSHGDTKALIAQWGPLFQEHRVHAYLCGHDHDLQHLELEGLFTSFVLSGGGGANTRKLDSDRKMPYGDDVHGFTHLRVARKELVLTHLDASAKPLHRFIKRTDGSFEIA